MWDFEKNICKFIYICVWCIEDMLIIYIYLIYFVNIFFMFELRECVFLSVLD